MVVSAMVISPKASPSYLPVYLIPAGSVALAILNAKPIFPAASIAALPINLLLSSAGAYVPSWKTSQGLVASFLSSIHLTPELVPSTLSLNVITQELWVPKLL